MAPVADEFAFHTTVVILEPALEPAQPAQPTDRDDQDTHPNGHNCNATCHFCGACGEHVYQCDRCGRVAETRDYALDFSRDPHGHTCYGDCPASDEGPGSGPERTPDPCACGSRHVAGIHHFMGEGEYTERTECGQCGIQEEDMHTCPCRFCGNWLCPECGWEGDNLHVYYTCDDCDERYDDEDDADKCNVWRCDHCAIIYCDEDSAVSCYLGH